MLSINVDVLRVIFVGLVIVGIKLEAMKLSSSSEVFLCTCALIK